MQCPNTNTNIVFNCAYNSCKACHEEVLRLYNMRGALPLSLNDYQNNAEKTAVYNPATDKWYTVLGLCGEAGEVAEKTKKYFRDNTDYETTRAAICKELGDVLWYLAMCAKVWGYSLEEVAQTNIDKLAARRVQGKIHGNGDDREQLDLPGVQK